MRPIRPLVVLCLLGASARAQRAPDIETLAAANGLSSHGAAVVVVAAAAGVVAAAPVNDWTLAESRALFKGGAQAGERAMIGDWHAVGFVKIGLDPKGAGTLDFKGVSTASLLNRFALEADKPGWWREINVRPADRRDMTCKYNFVPEEDVWAYVCEESGTFRKYTYAFRFPDGATIIGRASVVSVSAFAPDGGSYFLLYKRERRPARR